MGEQQADSSANTEDPSSWPSEGGGQSETDSSSKSNNSDNYANLGRDQQREERRPSLKGSQAEVAASSAAESSSDKSNNSANWPQPERDEMAAGGRPKAGQQEHHLARCSALGGSRRRSSRRRKSGQPRQVRFQPLAQPIEPPPPPALGGRTDEPESKLAGQAEFGAQRRAGWRSRRVQLAAKPLTRRLHHLSNIRFNKIKLRSFNTLAHHFQQTIAASYQQADSFKPSSERQQQQQQQAAAKPKRASQAAASSNGLAANATLNEHANEEDFGWGSDFDEQSLDSSHADETSSGGYLLEIGKSSGDFRAIGDVIQDQGISGQFKRIELSVCPSPERCSPLLRRSSGRRRSRSREQETAGEPLLRLQRQESGQRRLRLELEQFHCDRMAGEPALGHLEREGGSACWRPAEGRQAEARVCAQAERQDEEEEEEAELRSLEARQGFKQIRDKLKVILDQRLASYERSACAASGADSATSGAISQAANKIVNADTTSPAHSQAKESCGKTGAATITTLTTTATTTATTKSAAAAAATGGIGEFDCQSHCSDESSSSGLDSNHSGSQDSGHSTQHSGYSAHSCPLGRSHRHSSAEPSPSAQSDGGPPPSCIGRAVHDGPHSLSPPSESPQVNANEQQTTDSLRPKVAPADHESQERRNRFLQNRLIINSKLESMFKSRNPQKGPSSSQAARSLAAVQSGVAFAADGQRPLSAQTSWRSQPTVNLLPNLHTQQSCQERAVSNESGKQSGSIEPETRLRLLEQQRQMSLKLKQKPRRKSAKRALMNPATILDSNNTDDNGSYASCSSSSELYLAGSHLSRYNQDSLTKQLSMICLRQAGQPVQSHHESATSGQANHLHQRQQSHLAASAASPAAAAANQVGERQQVTKSNSNSNGNASREPRPALSLRQLVKDVIDDCEKPGKLSTLTMSILNRSDSLSSDLAISADETSSCAPDPSRPSTLGSASRNEMVVSTSDQSASSSSSLSSLSDSNRQPSPADQRQSRCPCRHSASNEQRSPPHCYQQHHQLRGQHSTPQAGQRDQVNQPPPLPVDQSLSSVGSIDGLEYNRTCSELSFDQRLSGTPARGGHSQGVGLAPSGPARLSPQTNTVKRAPKSTIGSYLKSLREISRFKLPKVKLISGNTCDNQNANGYETSAHLAANNKTSDFIGQKSPPLKHVGYNVQLNSEEARYKNHNYEYQLDAFATSTARQPEGSSTIAGAWRSRIKRASVIGSPVSASSVCAKEDGLTNHFVTISNRKWKSCHLRTSLMQIGFTGNGDNNCSANSGSQAKQHLAYLDNSRNFTDDDHYY